jgi:hypothetical protein
MCWRNQKSFTKLKDISKISDLFTDKQYVAHHSQKFIQPYDGVNEGTDIKTT